MLCYAGNFLRAFVKAGKNMAFRTANDWAGKPCHTLLMEGVCAWTDEGVEALWKLIAERFRTTQERREAVQEMIALPPEQFQQEIERAIVAEASNAEPQVKVTLRQLAETLRSNIEAQADSPGRPGQSVLQTDIALETRAQLTVLLRGDSAEVSSAALSALKAGDVVAERFRIERLIGRGGMGIVYEATDRLTRAKIALKTLRPELTRNREFLRLFLNEGQLCKKLAHDNVIRVHDLGIDRERSLCFLTMELVRGMTLENWLQAKPQGVGSEEFRQIAGTLGEALAYAHTHRVLHLDIKPGNVMVNQDLTKIKVLDFGLGRVLAKLGQTQPQAAGFSPYYAAPEQKRGSEASERMDVYSFSAVLYRVLTNTHPHPQAPPLHQARPDLPRELCDWIARAMCLEPRDRISSIAELQRGIEATQSVRKTGRGAARRRLARYALSGCVVLMAILLIAVFVWKRNPVEKIPAAPGVPSRGSGAAPSVPMVASAQGLTLDLGGDVALDLVRIEPGEILMGSPASEQDRGGDEGPQRRVRISKPFYLGKYEVTQKQWQAVTGNNPSYRIEDNDENLPVNEVSWNDCQDFCRKLAAQTGQAVRLPTEAEWEYACRAGTTTRFSFGNDDDSLRDYGWCKGNNRPKTYPVGGKKPNAWGLYDMHGNVWEWCQDWYGENYYKNRPDPDVSPTGPESGSGRVLRGGSWNRFPNACRAAARDSNKPGFRNRNGGLRIVLEIP